jgi:hypothetical protein
LPRIGELPVPRVDRSPTGQVAFVRRRTEAVFAATLDAMLGALDDLDVTASSLVSLAETLSPEAMARLRAVQPMFHDLGAQVSAKSDRCRVTVRSLDRLMSDGRHRLEDLRSLARTATLVSLNALVVSRSLSSDGGTIDGLAQSMRSVLGEVGGLVSELGAAITAGLAELRQVEQGATTLAEVAQAEALPAIAEFADLVQARSRDERVARSARLVSKRFEALQQRVGQVVLHLQVGDSFRQRLEHVETLLAKADDLAGDSGGEALRMLAAAQLRAALADLGQDTHAAVRQLRSLARTAADIPRIGAVEDLRGSGREGLGALTAASARIGGVIGTLTEASERLTASSQGLAGKLADTGQNVGEAAEFERRMTVLGLNAILLASRLGPEGRAMEEVAQQQRDIARSIIEVMGQLRRDLEGVVVASGDLDTGADRDLAGTLRTAEGIAGEIMGLSHRVKGHLTAMEAVRDAREILELVDRARSEIEGFARVAAGLDEVAWALDQGGKSDGIGEEERALLAWARRLYSMQAEREVHDALFPAATLSEAAASSVAELDDVLFA